MEQDWTDGIKARLAFFEDRAVRCDEAGEAWNAEDIRTQSTDIRNLLAEREELRRALDSLRQNHTIYCTDRIMASYNVHEKCSCEADRIEVIINQALAWQPEE